MIIRIGGGNDGIAEYLENGRKAEREFTRDELDQRLVLDGDLALTNSVIQSIDNNGQERYLHITLSFYESEISEEKLYSITEDYKRMLMTAYDEQEFSFYAEAHLPKIKHLIDNKTGELVERKPHIHIVIPRTNLVTGKSMNPRGNLKDSSTKSMMDAIQEHLNHKYGLVSPKERVRVTDDNQSKILSRVKGDLFRERQGALKKQIHDDMNKHGVNSIEKFHDLLKNYGDVKIRNAGKENAYFAVKFQGDEKYTNLKNPLFSKEYIESRELSIKKPSVTEIQKRVDDWVNQKSLEIKYVYPSSAKRRQAYKSIPNKDKRDTLKRIDHEYREKFQLPTERRRENDRQRSVEYSSRKFVSQRTFGLPRMPECGLVYGLRGLEASSTKRVLSDNAERDLAKRGDRKEDLCSSVRWDEHLTGGVKSIAESSVLHEVIFSHINDKAQENERELFSEIRKNIDPERFLSAAKQAFNITPEEYKITTAKDGSMRVRVGQRNMNASDFLTKHINLPWHEAREFLLKVYAEQQSGKKYQLDSSRLTESAVKERLDSLKSSKRYLSQFVSQERRAVYAQIKQLRAELRYVPKEEREIAKGVIAYVKITSMERIAEKEHEARNFISQYHANWTESKDAMKTLDKIKRIIMTNDGENTITCGKNSSLGLKEAIHCEKQVREYIKLKDLAVSRTESKIEYCDPESKKAVFIDKGLRVVAKTDDKAAIGIMLEYAKEKFGGSLKLNGSEEFKQLCAEVAAEKGMNIIIHPDKYHQIMQERKAELAASIESAPMQSDQVTLDQKRDNDKAGNEHGDKPLPSEQNPLGASASSFDELRDVPAYLRNPVEKEKTDDAHVDLAEQKNIKEILLDEFEKKHAARDLAFNREFERNEIKHLSDDGAREYLQEALNSRMERASTNEKTESEM